MASARDGTPITAHKEDRLISEFDPIGSTAKKHEDCANNYGLGLTNQSVPCSLKNNFVQEEGYQPGMAANIMSPKCKMSSLTAKKNSTGNLHQTPVQD
jgi:hypothetical protein